MRMAQIYGLTDEAEKFISENVEMIPEYNCECGCGKTYGSKRNCKVYETINDVGFGTKLDLCEWVLKNGEHVREVMNHYTPWSSGRPYIFSDLVKYNGYHNGEPLFTWTESEINEVI